MIAATHRDLEEMAEQGSFRRDLLFRLNAVEIRVPPLRERMEDIPALVQHFIERHCHEAGKPLLAISSDAMQRLLSHAWSKGNVRELSNTLERMVIFCEGDTIHIENLPENIQVSEMPGALNLCQAVQEFESRHIASVLMSAGGDREMVAKALGVSRATLYRYLQRLKLWERALPSDPESQC